MKVSIVIPVFNEVGTLLEIIKQVKNAPLIGDLEKEIVIVDDYSSDGTRELLNNMHDDEEINIFYHDINKGKGAALKTGFQNCSGDILIIQDADLEYDPNEYPQLLEPIVMNKANVVYGSRYMSGKPHRVLYYWHTMANKFLTICSNAFSNLNLSDMETCYKVFRKSIIDKMEIEENRFGFESEFTAKLGDLARKENIRVYEIGISYYGRTFEEGKKIGFKDALHALWCIFIYNNSRFAHLVKYFIFGVLIALSQYISIFILIEWFGLSTNDMQNIANVIAILISFAVAFIIHSKITWRYKFKSKLDLMIKIFIFYLVSSISLIIRVLVFDFLLSKFGMPYTWNTLIGIFIVIIMNFMGYDKIVFKAVYKK